MPPKTPNLKFKPKLVRQSEVSEDAKDDDHEVMLRQLERRNRAQQEAASQEVKAPVNPVESGFSSSSAQAPVGRSAGSADAPRQSRSLLSQHEALSDIFFPPSSLPQSAPALPINSLHTSLCQKGEEEFKTYRPISLGDRGPAEKPVSEEKGGEESGTAFLRAIDDETANAYASNAAFHESVMSCVNEGSDQSCLVWLQVPKFHPGNVPFDLTAMPPGRIGEVKVYESGRMVMEINGCYFDMFAEDPNEDSCCLAAATRVGDAAQSNECYLLGTLQHKLVCTPTLSEDA